MILVSKLNKQYMIGLTQEPFDTNDDVRTDGRTVWNLDMLLHLKKQFDLDFNNYSRDKEPEQR